jgi:4-coumarate--CoA ligase
MIHRSARPDVAIPDMGLAAFVLAGLRGREDEPALIDGLSDSVMSRGALTQAARRFAGGLAARGIGPGTVIALMAPNCPEFVVVFLGAAIAGATLTTVNPTYTAQELRHQLDDSGARLLVAPPALAALASEAIAGGRVAEIVLLPGEGGGGTGWARFLDAAPADPAPLDPARAVAVLP